MKKKPVVLLDAIISLTSYAYISDLVSPNAYGAVKSAVLQLVSEDYPLCQWCDAANYILQNDTKYEDIAAAREALISL